MIKNMMMASVAMFLLAGPIAAQAASTAPVAATTAPAATPAPAVTPAAPVASCAEKATQVQAALKKAKLTAAKKAAVGGHIKKADALCKSKKDADADKEYDAALGILKK